MKTQIVYPFSAVIGQERMKRALILNAIQPRIGGVLIRGEKGTAKSTTVRALADLLPRIEAVDGCPYACHPSRPDPQVNGKKNTSIRTPSMERCGQKAKGNK